MKKLKFSFFWVMKKFGIFSLDLQGLNKDGVPVNSAIYYMYEGKLIHKYFSHELSKNAALAVFKSKYDVETEIIEML